MSPTDFRCFCRYTQQNKDFLALSIKISVQCKAFLKRPLHVLTSSNKNSFELSIRKYTYNELFFLFFLLQNELTFLTVLSVFTVTQKTFRILRNARHEQQNTTYQQDILCSHFYLINLFMDFLFIFIVLCLILFFFFLGRLFFIVFCSCTQIVIFCNEFRILLLANKSRRNSLYYLLLKV